MSKATNPNLTFSSEALLQQAVAGLLSRMPEVTEVQILQGPQETGKDIVFNIQGGFGEKIFCACVVKNTKITGDVSKPGGARTVYFQAEQSFDSNYTDSLGKDIRVERVYVVTPYDLPISTIASISGKLKERSGQLKFIGGSNLFDLFKKYWPDFLADEAGMIEQHLHQMQTLYVDENPLPSLAFQYSLGSVSSTLMSVYVTHGFHREIRAYDLGEVLTSSLPDPRVLTAKLSKDSIVKLQRSFERFDNALDYLREWHLVAVMPEKEKLEESLKKLFSDLMEHWQIAFDEWKLKQLKQGREVEPEPIWLPEADQFVDGMKDLIELRFHCLSGLRQELQRLKQTVASPKFQGVSSFESDDYRMACYLNECARAAPDGIFSYSNAALIVTFPQTILEEWSGPLLIVGAPGFGKTSFCRWHALLDTKQYNVGESNVLPVYVPLHQFSRKHIGTFQETFLQRLGQSGLITNRDQTLAGRVRVYLDGLDEVALPERRKELVDLAKTGAAENPHYQIVITSRDYEYGHWLDWTPKIYLSEFNDVEVKEFIDKWLGDSSDSNKQFHSQLRNMPTLYHLLKTPLLATLVIMVFRQTGRLPESKSRLYEMFIDLLSGGWDVAKGILRGSKYGQRIKVIILSSLAGKVHTLRRREFTDDDIKIAIESSLLGLNMEDWEVLRDELVGDGLIGRSGGIMYFSHLSFQEFLTAKVFMGSPHPTRSQKALESYVNGDDWWKEVLKFYISLSSSPEVVSNWLVHQLENLQNRYKRLSLPHVLELLGTIVESFPEFRVEELAQRMKPIVNYGETLSFLKQVHQRISEV